MVQKRSELSRQTCRMRIAMELDINKERSIAIRVRLSIPVG